MISDSRTDRLTELRKGDVVRPKWGQRSGRWLVLRSGDNEWHRDWVKVRCLTVPRYRRPRKKSWRVGDEGWVSFMLELVPPRYFAEAGEPRYGDLHPVDVTPLRDLLEPGTYTLVVAEARRLKALRAVR